MIPLLQTKTADTAHMGIFANDTGLLSRFLGVGPGDEAEQAPHCIARVHVYDVCCLLAGIYRKF